VIAQSLFLAVLFSGPVFFPGLVPAFLYSKGLI